MFESIQSATGKNEKQIKDEFLESIAFNVLQALNKADKRAGLTQHQRIEVYERLIEQLQQGVSMLRGKEGAV